MRLWVVGSIIALILSMYVSMNALQLVLLVMLCLLLLIHILTVQRVFVPRIVTKWASLFHVNKLYVIILGALFSVYYAQSWIDERLQSRLPMAMTGVVVEGVADVVDCQVVIPDKAGGEKSQKNTLKRPERGIEKLTLNVVSIAATDPQLSALKTLTLNYYFQVDQALLAKSSSTEGCQAAPQHGRIQFSAKLRAPYSFINPYVFDYEAWLLSKGIDAAGYLKSYQLLGADHDGASGDGSKSKVDSAFRLRAIRQQGIQRAAAFHGMAGQVLPALLFGESRYLGAESWSDLQATGTVHLLIVSGLHVGFLAMLVLLIWRTLIKLEMLLLANSRSYLLRITPLILLFICLIYSYMAGMGLAVQRAGLMMAIALVVIYGKRHWSPFDTWLWVMWLVLMINPLVSLFVGFWFSFVAVGALLISYIGITSIKFESDSAVLFAPSSASNSAIESVSPLERSQSLSIKPRNQPISWRRIIDGIYRPQWIVFLALIPFLWLFQQSNSVFSLALNIVAIPLLAFVILPLSIAVYVSANTELLALLNAVLEISFSVLSDISQRSTWQIYKPSGYWLVCLIPMIGITLLPTGFPFRRLCLWLTGILWLAANPITQDRLWVLDVGQGLAVYGQSQNGTDTANWLYDTGAQYRSGFSLGEAVVAKHIIGATGNHLERLFISHSDNDHAGGEAGIKKKISIDRSMAGQPSRTEHANCHQQTGRWNVEAGYRWRVFPSLVSESYSQTQVALSDNNQSCVVQLEMQGVRILLPGDIEKTIEEALVRVYASELASDVLIVPHHGSKTSSGRAFVMAVNPAIAIVSSGYGNAFNHPHQQVTALFKQQNIPVYNTAISGAIEINLHDVANVTEWRKKNPPKWRQM